MSDSESNDSDVMDEWAEAMAEAGDVPDANLDEAAEAEPEAKTETKSSDAGVDAAAPEVQPAPLDPLEDTSVSTGADKEINLDVILDVPVEVSMEIGSTKMNIRNLLHLNQGSVVELDRLAGEPLNVKVNGTLIAHGEVVVVNEKFGIRLTDIISPAERVKKLS
ncbi:MAG TPA: flagellar motor switch protein FliN [Gammaproteobacteria bacterium]|nr:flagellar motor switch protein FliN [Gammaproteobacteria bacterium]